jgi:hypothetical protein
VEFLQTTTEQRDHVHQMIKTLRENADKTPELQVEPEGLETSALGDSFGRFEILATQSSAREASGNNAISENEDTLIELFRHKFEIPVESFLQQMREQRHSVETHSN